MMKLRNLLCGAILVALTLTAACAMKSEDARSAAPPPDALTDARFYTGTSGNQGVFAGELVREREGRKFALRIAGDPTVHPLLPGDATVMARLKAMPHGAPVSINGTLFPDLGVIVVSGITVTP